ncbi:MAG TPA: hypothetical protein PKV98_04680 [Burkholderiaceae bacterium]|nr:hypothetical protein [Burkholderiaceae bacterium]
MGMNIAKLGYLAGGLSSGINQGMNIAGKKQALDAGNFRLAQDKLAASRADIFSSLMKGLISGDGAALDTVRLHFGMPAQTVTSGGSDGQVGGEKYYADGGMGSV